MLIVINMDYGQQKINKNIIKRTVSDCLSVTKRTVPVCLIGNFTFEEIAKITGKTANWARVKYFRGKEKLKEENRDEERM